VGTAGGNSRPNQTNAARASHPSRTHVISCACPITAKQRNDRFSPTALEVMPSAAFAEASCRFVIFRSRSINRRSGQRSCPAPKSRLEEEAATPGQPVRACARFLDFPPAQFTLQNHRLRLTLPQSFRKLRKLHVSLDPLSARSVAPRNTKTSPTCEEAVEDETSLWKNEENREVLQFCKQLPMRSQSLPCGQTIPRRSAMNRSCDYQALKTQMRLESSHQYRHCPEMIPAHRLFLRKSLVPL
jgi:hypothetical protein